jgi:uncharacterized protein with WD repeat
VWDLRTGKLLREFLFANVDQNPPSMKFSFDDKYVARLDAANPDHIFVYETPSMALADNKPIKVIGVEDFSWHPKAHILLYCVPDLPKDNPNKPGAVVLFDFRTRIILAQKNIWGVSDVSGDGGRGGGFPPEC